MTETDPARLRFQARIMASQLMIAHGQSMSADALRTFGEGFVEGVRDALTSYANSRVAYEVVQAVADTSSVPLLKPADEPL